MKLISAFFVAVVGGAIIIGSFAYSGRKSQSSVAPLKVDDHDHLQCVKQKDLDDLRMAMAAIRGRIDEVETRLMQRIPISPAKVAKESIASEGVPTSLTAPQLESLAKLAEISADVVDLVNEARPKLAWNRKLDRINSLTERLCSSYGLDAHQLQGHLITYSEKRLHFDNRLSRALRGGGGELEARAAYEENMRGLRIWLEEALVRSGTCGSATAVGLASDMIRSFDSDVLLKE